MGEQSAEKITAGQVVKGMILNGLGLVSSPLYLFSRFFEGKMDTVHLDSSSFSVQGEYETTPEELDPRVVNITYGYSRERRPDLKQFLIELICKKYQMVIPGASQDKSRPKPSPGGEFKGIFSESIDRISLSGSAQHLWRNSTYKGQQSVERGFRFLKDPYFLTDSVFLKSPHRIEALGLIMGLCLLVYTWGQRQLRFSLKRTQSTVKNQLGRPTDRPTLRWIFQCFQSIHLLLQAGVVQVSNLTPERLWMLKFFPPTCQRYYQVKL